MTEQEPYDRIAIREFIITAFNVQELRELFYFAENPDLQLVLHEFADDEGLPAMVLKAVSYCERHHLLGELLAAAKEKNPRQYAIWEARTGGFLRQLAAPESTAPAQPLDAEAVARYLEAVRIRCSLADTRPYRQLSEQRGEQARLSLLDEKGRGGVYVPLRYDLHLSRPMLEDGIVDKSLREGKELREQVARDLSRTDVALAEVLATPGHLVFIGAAGCGKSTLLRLVATILAAGDEALARDELAIEGEPGALPLPVFLALRDFEHACQSQPGIYRRDVDGLLCFLDDHFQRWHSDARVPPGFVSGLVRAGRAWLLLDALDEVADFDHRITVRQVIEQLANVFPGNRLLVTARVAAYSTANTRLDERFTVATVRDLTREQWAPLVERLYAGLEADPGVAAERARLLLERIDSAPALQEMVKTPLMVWTATMIHFAERELPEQRAELYRAYVDVLLGERLHEEESAESAQVLREARWPMEDRRLYLTYAAYQVHQEAEDERSGGEHQALVIVDERDLVRRILAPFLADYLGLGQHQARREAQDFVALMAERSGLLHPHEEGYSFGDHLTVQEFLAANYLVDNLRGSGEWTEFLQNHAGQTWWREVFLLMAGYLLQWPQQARRFLLAELGKLPDEGDAHAYGLAWAGRALLEIPAKRVGWHATVRDELARRLVKVLWQNPPTTSVAARVEAGDVLGLVGDPRFSGEILMPEFIAIPGGRFWMGSEETEEGVRENEVPRHEVELDAFALARYPTSNAMFRCFVEAGGYGEERWWSEAQAAGVWLPDGTVRDWLSEEPRDTPAYWGDTSLNGSNQPVVGVTWYEAVAYCRWLTDALADGHAYRLPTEAEWERAARGPEGQRYPWGDEWAKGRANTKELNLERTTPVGIFADGASAEGVLDLSGNVWEWCSTLHRAYPYDGSDGREDPGSKDLRVLRGGAYWNDRDAVRCACRSDGVPVGRYDFYGFRVARGPLK